MATIYVDASRPDDSGNGLTVATAKRTPRAAVQVASAGDKILLKSGYCYDPLNGAFMNINNVSNIEIGTYGIASDKPILDALTYENPGATGWKYVSGGIWKKTFGAAYIRRLWIGSTSLGNLVSQRVVGTAKRRATGPGMTGAFANPSEATILASLNWENIWFAGGPATSYALYIYTGPAVIPPTYYGGLAFIQSDGWRVGAMSGIEVENQTNIYAHDLHFRGNPGPSIRLSAKNSNVRDVSGCLFEDCMVTHPFQGAFMSRIQPETSPARRCRSSTVRRVYSDYSTHPDEVEPDMTFNYLSGIGDLFSIADGSVGITIEECTAVNSPHNGISSGSIGMATTPPTGCKAVSNTIRFAPWHTYGRGISNFDADTVFTGNLIDGQNTRSQISGSAKVKGNVWINLRTSTRKAGISQWITVESYMYDSYSSGIGNERYIRVNPVNVVIAHNTVYSPVDSAITFYFHDTPIGAANNSFDAGTVTVKNNIIYSPVGRFLTTFEVGEKVIGQQQISHNCIYNAVAGDKKISWRGTRYAINAAPGFTQNIEDDPQLDCSYRPRAAPLIGTGAYLGGNDFYGKAFNNPPNRGAVDPL